MTIWTIGYEGVSLDQFLELLKANGIEHLVDIREAPISRKVGFAKSALSEAVGRAGMQYSHVQALGCPKPIRDRHRETADWGRYTRDFKIYLAGQNEALAQLRATVVAARTCLLCYEADHNRCHRTFVAEAISSPADELRHIAVTPPSRQSELAFG